MLQENLHRWEQVNGNVKQNIPYQSYPSGFALLCGDTYGRGGAEALHQNKPTWEQRISVWEDPERLTNHEGETLKVGEKQRGRERGTGAWEPGKAKGGLGCGWESWCSALLLASPLEPFQRTPRYLIKASQAAGSTPRPAIFHLQINSSCVAGLWQRI